MRLAYSSLLSHVHSREWAHFPCPSPHTQTYNQPFGNNKRIVLEVLLWKYFKDNYRLKKNCGHVGATSEVCDYARTCVSTPARTIHSRLIKFRTSSPELSRASKAALAASTYLWFWQLSSCQTIISFEICANNCVENCVASLVQFSFSSRAYMSANLCQDG